MAPENKKFNLNKDQKSSLFELGKTAQHGPEYMDNQDRKADLLYDILVSPLPADAPAADSLPPLLKRMYQGLHSLAGDSLEDLLQKSDTEPAVINKIKDYAKQVGKSETGDDHDIAVAVYYAAIAHALVYHNQLLTQFSYGQLADAFHSLIKKDWICDILLPLFEKAEAICKDRI